MKRVEGRDSRSRVNAQKQTAVADGSMQCVIADWVPGRGAAQ